MTIVAIASELRSVETRTRYVSTEATIRSRKENIDEPQ